MKQEAFSFDKETLKKIGKGALIAGGGAAVVDVLQFVQWYDFGAYSAIVGAVCSTLINALREYVKGE